jgi:hypothetical protein
VHVLTGDAEWLDDDLQRRIVSTFRSHGVDAAIYVARGSELTEVTFVVGPVAVLPEVGLTRVLVELLHRKVSIATNSEVWEDVGLDRLDAR